MGLEMRRQHLVMAAAIARCKRGVPGAMSPAEMAAALDALCASPMPSPPATLRLLDSAARMLIRRELAPAMLIDGLRRRYWNRFESADPAAMLMRAVHLAMTFDQCRAASASISPAASLSA